MKSITPLAATAAASLTAFALAACGGGSTDASGPATPPRTASGRTATVGVTSDSNLGKILDDRDGRTVYLFAKDSGTTSACTGPCASAWPPLRVSGKPLVGAGAIASIVGTTERPDGHRQLTYNGHPLYTYTGDQKPGDTNGQGLTAFGGGWFVLSPAGKQISGTGSNGGSGGY